MVNNCSPNDIEQIIKLGKLININFDKVNNLNEVIKNKQIIGYYLDNKIVGFIIFEQLYEVIDILYVVVDTLYRKKHIASSLMDYIINNNNYERIMLEVRCDNIAAIKLYKKYNFKIINIRQKYYKNNDAYIMEMKK